MIKTSYSLKIKELLEQDLIQNQNILGIIENTDKLSFYVDDIENPQSVLVNKGYFNYISTKQQSFIEDLIENYFKEDFYGFSGLSEFVTEKLKPRFVLQWESPCELYYLPENALDLTLRKHETSTVQLADAQLIDEHYAYRGDGSLDRIKDDITRRPSSAVYVNGEPASWVLVHQDNSMGIMYTMEQHRGNGYAVDVTIDLCEKLINKGKIPFLQINVHNKMSPGLASKCGFVKHGRGNWFGGFLGVPEYFRERQAKVFPELEQDLSVCLKQNDQGQGATMDFIVSPFIIPNETAMNCSLLLREVSIDSVEELEAWCRFVAGQQWTILKEQICSKAGAFRLFVLEKDDGPVATAIVYAPENEVGGLVLPRSKDEELGDSKYEEEMVRSLLYKMKVEDMDTIIFRAPKHFEQLLVEIGAIGI